MNATPEATAAYHARRPGLHTSVLGRTGLTVSGAGFGGYRISQGVETHRLALLAALRSGINLIDTSANYADGGSEELIGETLQSLFSEGGMDRSEVVVVTKGGYLQGSNYNRAVELARRGEGFPDVVEYGEGLWHCIAPEFLEDQITHSLQRLSLSTIDVYLLHNPEYYLNWAAQHIPLEEARREYARRIRAAFEYLETEVERGRIAWYGVSSNSFPHPSDATDFTSFAELHDLARECSPDHHFAVIQFPANLAERGFVRERNGPNGETLMELARREDMGVLINRPLNAIVDNGLVRLADFPLADMDVAEKDISGLIEKVMASENRFAVEMSPAFSDDEEGRRGLLEFAAVGSTMAKHWASFGTVEHFNDVLSQYFAPRLGFIAQYLRRRGMQEHLDWYAAYMGDVRALFRTVSAHYSRSAQKRSDQIRTGLARTVGASAGEGTLSSLAVRLLLGIDGVDSVLVGMRREEYVEDILRALRRGALSSQDAWEQLPESMIVTESRLG